MKIKKIKRFLISYIIYLLVLLCKKTYRIKIQCLENRNAIEKNITNGNFLLALWHEHLFTGIIAHSNQKITPLTSLSTDGDIVDFILRKLKYPRTVRGSTNRGGVQAKENIIKLLAEGFSPAIAVDGPKGPRRIVKRGIIDLASQSSKPILGFVIVTKSPFVLTKSWDKFKIPKPFSTIILRYTSPIYVPKELTTAKRNEFKKLLAQHLLESEEQAYFDLG